MKGLGRAAFAFVANGSPYTYAKRLPLPIAPERAVRARPRRRRSGARPPADARPDGALDPRRPRAPVGRDTLYGHDLDRVEIVCDRPTALHADGEDLGDVEEALFEAERGAVSVLV